MHTSSSRKRRKMGSQRGAVLVAAAGRRGGEATLSSRGCTSRSGGPERPARADVVGDVLGRTYKKFIFNLNNSNADAESVFVFATPFTSHDPPAM
mmetsp:Transcript_13464/g.33032  ORF Transcript_13464/g.33032 Transcript_13464/m.33032 type:complete len:95 (+) Transcript_13464:1363-1647(+)